MCIAGSDKQHAAEQSTTSVPLATGQPAAAMAANNTGKLSVEDTVVYLIPASAGQAPAQKLATAVGCGQHTGLEDAPSAEAAWEEAQDVLRVWLGMAAGTIVLW